MLWTVWNLVMNANIYTCLKKTVMNVFPWSNSTKEPSFSRNCVSIVSIQCWNREGTHWMCLGSNKWYLVAVYYNGLLLKDLFFVLPQFGSEPSRHTGTSHCFLKTGIQVRKHAIHHQGKLKPFMWTDLNQIFVIAIKFCPGISIITFGTILVG